MSYYAEGYGCFDIKTQENTDALEKVIDDLVENSPFETLMRTQDGKKVIELSFYENYHEDVIVESLNTLIPYVTEGSQIAFTGEDEGHWMYELADGKWNERNGAVIYPDSPQPGAFYIERQGARFYLTDAELKEAAKHLEKKAVN